MADGKAFTGTPDLSAGNPVDVAIVQTASGTVDRQRVVIGDAVGTNADVLSMLLQSQQKAVDLLERIVARLEAHDLMFANAAGIGYVTTDDATTPVQ